MKPQSNPRLLCKHFAEDYKVLGRVKPKSYRRDLTEGLNLLTLHNPLEYPLLVGAQVAELVDAQVSGTCGRKAVEVRVFSWAPLPQHLIG